QEQMLMQQDQGPSAKKVTRLEALFMPPFDILFSGGFDQAQRHGNSVDRWLLVNLQDDLNFSCQTLNRDLWSDARLKEFMRHHLVFWQQSNKTTDGAKFKTFYKVRSEPYIGMIDPRTGEEVRNLSGNDLSPARFLETLKTFLVENKSPHGKEINLNRAESDSEENDRPPRPTGSSSSSKHAADVPKAGSSAPASPHKQKEAPATEQAKSTNAPSTKCSDEEPAQHPWEKDDRSLPTLDDEPAAPVLSSDSESSLAPDQKTRILLKMPGNVTERLFFRSSRTLEQAIAKLRQKYEQHCRPTDATVDVRFFCQAIKSDLAVLDTSKTLLELKIHPNAVIHVTTDD
uniref:UAS domain-containing protein n=1 Tax=Anopheles coluzzii TaxID=1518534 RepID=A0A6E8W8E1_ANOCL